FLNAAAAAQEAQLLFGHVPPAVKDRRPLTRVGGSRHLDLAIGLPLRNRQELTNLLHDLYDPASSSYHKFLTPEQFAQKFGPTEAEYRGVVSFLKSKKLSIVGTHSNRLLVDVNGSVADIEEAFRTRLQVYQHPREDRTFFAPEIEPSLDNVIPIADVSGLDDYILPHPMSLHPMHPRQAATTYAGSASGGALMGNDFRAAYLPGVTLIGTGQTVGLVEFDGYYANDITTYESQAGLTNIPLQNVLLNHFNGRPGANNVEVA